MSPKSLVIVIFKKILILSLKQILQYYLKIFNKFSSSPNPKHCPTRLALNLSVLMYFLNVLLMF